MRCLGNKRNFSGEGRAPGLADYLDARTGVVRRVLENADALVAPSQFARAQFARAFGAAIAGKIEVLAHGVDVAARAQRPQPSGTLRVGFLGNLTDRKGGYIITEAAQRLRGKPVRIEVFGGVSDALRSPAQAVGLVLRGNYRRDELPALLDRTDLVVIPSIWDESFCLTVSEAQALGVPALASAAGGITERIVDGETGFLVPPGDAQALADRLLALAADRSALQRVQRRLQQQSVKSIDDNARDYAALYSRLLQDTRTDVLGLRVQAQPSSEAAADAYRAWCAARVWDDARCERLERRMREQWGQAPAVHVVAFCAYEKITHLPETLESLAGQLYGGWGLTVVGAGPCPHPAFRELPHLEWCDAGADPVAAANAAVRDTGADWVALVEPGDRLAPQALAAAIEAGQRHPEWQLLYSDEDVIDAAGARSHPRCKPDFNLDLLRSSPYVGGLCLLRRSGWQAAGGLAVSGAAASYDLALRVLDACGEAAIGHVAEVLYHCAEAPQRDAVALASTCEAALRGHFARRGISARIEPGYVPGSFFVSYLHAGAPKVSILVPTRDRLDLLQPCIDSLLRVTRYPGFEVIVVDNDSREAATREYLTALPERDPRVRVISHPGAFNFAAINNAAARAATGELLLLLNNDTLVVQPGWLERMVAHAQRPEVGVVGARLISSNQRLQHAGMVLGAGPHGVADHLHFGLPLADPGHMERTQLVQNFAAVTGACLMIRSALYARLGGLDEALGLIFSDVDLCLRAADLGCKIVWTPFATVVHHGAATLAAANAPERPEGGREEIALMHQRWGPRLAHDRAYNRNLSLLYLDARLEQELDTTWEPELRDVPHVMGVGFGSKGSWQYRVQSPLRALSAAARAETAVPPFRDRGLRLPLVAELARAGIDTLLLHNTVHDRHLEALQHYRKYTRSLLIFGQDDLMYALPPSNPFHRTVFKDIKKRLRRAMSLCDRLVVSTEPLAQAYHGFAEDIVVLPNFLARAAWGALRPMRTQEGKLRIGWAGALQHQGDLQVLSEVVRATSQEADWVFMGMCPEPLRPYVHEVHPAVDFADYPARLASLQLDLAVAPLEHNRFNEAKSNLRILEYGVLGLPVICTDIAPYRGAPVQRVPNQPRAWIEALRARIHDPDAAQREGANLRRWVLDGWMLEDHVDQWLEVLGGARVPADASTPDLCRDAG